MKTIVLAEKPSVGKELARVLNCRPKSKGHCEGQNYIVTWAMGHLVELADPTRYNEAWKAWRMEDLPMLPDKMKHKVIGRTSHQFRLIRSIFQRNDVSDLVIATDAGREGELVARWIMRLGGWKGKIKRLWISSQTDLAIRQGFQQLKDGHVYDNLFRAAECRAEADWIIGLNITRALSCKYDAQLSAGRVQTPTLALIIARENDIQAFVPEKYWTLQADLGDFTAIWQNKNGVNRFKDQNIANEIAAKTEGKTGVITAREEKKKSMPPPLAYDLTALQADANRILGFSAKMTLQVLQGLYERHKIATYPRTDSRHITTDMVNTLKDRIKAIENTQFKSVVKKLLQEDLKVTKRFVDNKKVSDHHAIIPTEERVQADRLNAEEKQLWRLIARRFLAVLSPDYRYNIITLAIDVEGQKFVAKGKKITSPGWKAIEGQDSSNNEEEDVLVQNLGKYSKGDRVTIKKIQVKQGLTQPPPRYTEGTLLEAMENAGKFIEEKELKESIKKGGLGTPATRADIIEKLFSNYYIEKNGKQLVPTGKGMELLEIVPEEFISPALTARWELRLSGIAQGEENSRTFQEDIRKNAVRLVNQVKISTIPYKPRNLSNIDCPICGKKFLTGRDKKGVKMLVCQSRSCGYEQKESEDWESGKQTRKQKAMVSKMIHKYTDTKSKNTQSFGDILKASLDKKKEK